MLVRVPSFQVLILESPYESLHRAETPSLFTEMLRLKLDGYRKTYAPGVLPLDTYDFVSTHLMIGTQENTEEGFRPLAAFRSVTQSRCDFHHLAFPGVAVLRSAGDHRQADALQRFLDDERRKAPLRTSFASAWTISPAMRAFPDLWAFLRDLSMSILVRHELEEKSERRLLCGVPKVKTDQFFEKCGYRRFESEGKTFPPFAQASLIGEEAVLLESTRFSPFAMDLAEKYVRFWDERIRIGHEDAAAAESFRKKAA